MKKHYSFFLIIIVLVLLVLPSGVNAEPPQLKLVVDPVSGDAPLKITFSENSGDSTITGWLWEFGDGNTFKEPKGEYIYESEGEYTLTLTVFNDKGEKTTGNVLITINPAVSIEKPVAAFAAEPVSGMSPLVTYFTDLSTNSPKEWIWNFGDGSTSTDRNTKHQYLKPNTYTVSLTVKNDAGENTVTKSGYITVTEKQDPGTVSLQEGVTETSATKVDLTSTTGSIKITEKQSGFEVTSSTKINNVTFTPAKTTINKTVIWDTGGTTPDVSFEYRYLGNSLKESVTLTKDADLKFPIQLSKDTKLIPWENGQWKLVSATSGYTMDGIILEKPFGRDSNGNYINMDYKYDQSTTTLHLVYNRTITVYTINESGKEPVEEVSYIPIKYPLIIDPTWTSVNSHWVSPDTNGFTLEMWNASGTGTFVATGNVTPTTTVWYWIVGGGGGGGKALGGGGGGAGAYWNGTLTNLTGTINVSVGAGGAAATVANTQGGSGGLSIFWNGTASNITANGGAGGGSRNATTMVAGGSGGGGESPNVSGVRLGSATNQAGHGFGGGRGNYTSTTNYSGGGGGGALSLGVNATSVAIKAGNGGRAINITLNGTVITLAGGGGGGTYNNTIGARGLGGNNTTGTVGGSGAYRTTAATAAVAATGSGGGGGGSTGAGTAGSGGVIYIRYQKYSVASFTANTTGGTTPITVSFTDTSTNTPTAWNWSYTNVSPGNGTEIWFNQSQNPIVTFGVGNWSIHLNATNGAGSNISAQDTFVNVSAAAAACTQTQVVFYTNGSSDGQAWRAVSNSTYSSVITGVATSSDNTTSAVYTRLTSTTDNQSDKFRVSGNAYYYFNTSSLPDTATVVSATLSVMETDDPGAIPILLGSPDYGIVGVLPYQLGVVNLGDYTNTSRTRFATDIPTALIPSVGTFTNWSFNVYGLSNISKTTFSNFSIAQNWYINQNFGGVWVGYENGSQARWYTAEAVAGAKPFLTVNYTDTACAVTPLSSFFANTTGGTTSVSVQFNDTSTNTPTSWNWSYADVTGNGTEIWFSTVEDPVITFGAGNWSIHLNATNAAGTNKSTQNTFVNVSGGGVSAPVASFTVDHIVVRMPQGVVVNDTSTNTPTGWQFSWGDGTANTTTKNATHQYAKRGAWNVTLTATNAGGSSTTTPVLVRVIGFQND